MSKPYDYCVTDIAEYMIEHHATIRDTGNHFNLARSTIHNIMMKTLPLVDDNLYNQVKQVMSENKTDRGKRGGKATSLRWAKIREERFSKK